VRGLGEPFPTVGGGEGIWSMCVTGLSFFDGEAAGSGRRLSPRGFRRSGRM
jgi:hypothetical protein